MAIKNTSNNSTPAFNWFRNAVKGAINSADRTNFAVRNPLGLPEPSNIKAQIKQEREREDQRSLELGSTYLSTPIDRYKRYEVDKQDPSKVTAVNDIFDNPNYVSSYFKGLSYLPESLREDYYKYYNISPQNVQDTSSKLQDGIFKLRLAQKYAKATNNTELTKTISKLLKAPQVYKGDFDKVLQMADSFMANLAMQDDIDRRSEVLDSNPKEFQNKYKDLFISEGKNKESNEEYNGFLSGNELAYKQGESVRKDAQKYLEQQKDIYKQQLDNPYSVWNTNPEIKESLTKSLDISLENIPEFKAYSDDDTLPINKNSESFDQEVYNQFLKNYSARLLSSNPEYAQRGLQEDIKNYLHDNQSLWGVTTSVSNQIFTEASGFFARMAIMAGSLPYALEEAARKNAIGEEYSWANFWNDFNNNDLAQWADRLSTTGAWTPSRQKELEELGLTDVPIFTTPEQDKQIFHALTLPQVLGQWGFTAASMFSPGILAKGIKLGMYPVSKLSRAKNVFQAIKGLEGKEALDTARKYFKMRDRQNFAALAMMGGIEGGMEASSTFNEEYKKLSQEASQQARQVTFSKYLNNLDEGALMYLCNKFNISRGDTSLYNSQTESYVFSKDRAINALLSNGGAMNFLESYNSKEAETNANAKAYQAEINYNEKDLLDKAYTSASTASFINFMENSMINGALNVGLKRTLYSRPIQESLRKSKIGQALVKDKFKDFKYVPESGGVAGHWESTKKPGIYSFIRNKVNESLGESLEEYNQNISNQIAQGISDSYFAQYFEHRYGNSDIAQAHSYDISKMLISGLKSGLDSALSQDAIREGVYGGLSVFLGGVGMNPNYLNTQANNRKIVTFNRNKESLITWSSALKFWNWNSELRNEQKSQNDVLNYLNKYAQDPHHAEMLRETMACGSSIRNVLKSVMIGDRKEMETAKAFEFLNMAFALDKMKGTVYADQVLQSLKEKSKFDIKNLGNPESAEQIALVQFASDPSNKEFIEQISKEAQKEENPSEYIQQKELELIKSNAKDLLSYLDSVKEKSKEIDNIFGDNISYEDKAAVATEMIMADRNKEAADRLDKTINDVIAKTKEANSDALKESSGLSGDTKSLVVSRGNTIAESEQRATELEEKIAEETKGLEEMEKSFKSKGIDLEEYESISPEEKANAMVYYLSKAQLENDELELNKLKSQLKAVNNETVLKDTEGNVVKEPVLTASDILELPLNERSRILNPSNSKLYSKAQRDQIDLALRLARSVDPYFSNHIDNRDRVERDYQNGQSRIKDFLLYPGHVSSLASTIKAGYQNEALKAKYGFLGDTTEYNKDNVEKVFDVLDPLEATQNEKEVEAALAILKEQNPEVYKLYNDAIRVIESTLDKASNTPILTNEQLPKNTRQALLTAIQTLAEQYSDRFIKEGSEDIPSEIYEKFKERLLNKIAKFNEVLNGNLELPQDFDTLFQNLLNELKAADKVKNEKERVTAMTPGETPSSTASNPIPTTPKSQIEQTPSSNKYSDSLESLSKTINSEEYKKLSEEQKKLITEAIKELLNDPSKMRTPLGEHIEDYETVVQSIMDLLPTNLEGRSSVEDSLNIIASNFYTEKTRREAEETARKTDIFNYQASRQAQARLDHRNPAKDNSQISIINPLNNPQGVWKNASTKLQQFLDEHKVNENYANLQAGNDIVFIVDKNLAGEYKNEEGDEGLLVFVAKETTDSSGNKKYEYVGILPANTNPRETGSALTTAIRKNALNDSIKHIPITEEITAKGVDKIENGVRYIVGSSTESATPLYSKCASTSYETQVPEQHTSFEYILKSLLGTTENTNNNILDAYQEKGLVGLLGSETYRDRIYKIINNLISSIVVEKNSETHNTSLYVKKGEQRTYLKPVDLWQLVSIAGKNSVAFNSDTASSLQSTIFKGLNPIINKYCDKIIEFLNRTTGNNNLNTITEAFNYDEGHFSVRQDWESKLSGLVKNFNTALKEYFYPVNGLEYTLTPQVISDGSVRQLVVKLGGNTLGTLTIEKEGDRITIGNEKEAVDIFRTALKTKVDVNGKEACPLRIQLSHSKFENAVKVAEGKNEVENTEAIPDYNYVKELLLYGMVQLGFSHESESVKFIGNPFSTSGTPNYVPAQTEVVVNPVASGTSDASVTTPSTRTSIEEKPSAVVETKESEIKPTQTTEETPRQSENNRIEYKKVVSDTDISIQIPTIVVHSNNESQSFTLEDVKEIIKSDKGKFLLKGFSKNDIRRILGGDIIDKDLEAIAKRGVDPAVEETLIQCFKK